ncbi:MAG: dihydrofolate reductase [Candidatus Cloacimonadales bacterium]
MRNNVTIIVAIDRKGVIGNENKMPWHIPEELQSFKRITLTHNIVMGRLTYESIGRLLPDRTNYIFSKDTSFSVPNAIMINSFGEMMFELLDKPDEQFFIIGGRSMFEQYLILAGKMIISEIDLDVVGDTYFPPFDKKNWKLVHEKKIVNNQNITIRQKYYERVLT